MISKIKLNKGEVHENCQTFKYMLQNGDYQYFELRRNQLYDLHIDPKVSFTDIIKCHTKFLN